MITLFQWPTYTKLPNSGMFCMKLETYLKAQKVPYKVESTIKIEKSPKKTMPYIERNGSLMADSQLIIEMLEKESASPMDAHLSTVQKGLSTAHRLMLENQLVYILMQFRWGDSEGWDAFSRQIFEGAPAPIRIIIGSFMRKDSLKLVQASGISRHSREEILSMARNTFASCSSLLGNQNFAFGEKISTFDCVLFSLLANILWAKVPNPLIQIVQKEFPTLETYAKRMATTVFEKEMW